MATFEYYATFDDCVPMLRDLCASGFRVITEPAPFKTPSAPTFATVTDELLTHLADAPNFYLAGAFTRFPVQFNQFKTGPAVGHFGINLLAQGPLMQALLGRVRTVDGRPTLLRGDTSYEDAYRNPETNVWEKASPELKAAHRSVVGIIKKRCVRHEKVFIGPTALRLLEQGEARFDSDQ